MAQPHHTPHLAGTEEALTVLFCLIDDTYALLSPRARRYESLKRLADSEVITLALFQQLRDVESERSFGRDVPHHPRGVAKDSRPDGPSGRRETHDRCAEGAEIVRASEETVRRWLKRYLAEGTEGLRDEPHPGAPRKVTEDYRELLVHSVRRRPRSLGLPFSVWTLRRLADHMAPS